MKISQLFMAMRLYGMKYCIIYRVTPLRHYSSRFACMTRTSKTECFPQHSCILTLTKFGVEEESMIFFETTPYIILTIYEYGNKKDKFFIFSTMFLKDLLMIATVNPNICLIY